MKTGCIRRFSGPYFPAFELNTGKYGPQKLGMQTLFTQCTSLVHIIENHENLPLILLLDFDQRHCGNYSKAIVIYGDITNSLSHVLQQQRLEGDHHKQQAQKFKRILDNTYIGKGYPLSYFNDISIYFQSQSVLNMNGRPQTTLRVKKR